MCDKAFREQKLVILESYYIMAFIIADKYELSVYGLWGAIVQFLNNLKEKMINWAVHIENELLHSLAFSVPGDQGCAIETTKQRIGKQ